MTDHEKLDKMISNAQAMVAALALTRSRGVTKAHSNLIVFNVLHNLEVIIKYLKELKNETKDN
jgi:hypothetical protein